MKTAVQYQLKYCKEMFGVESVVLADRRGLVVSATDERAAESQVIAAYAPLLVKAWDKLTLTQLMGSLSEYLPEMRREQLALQSFSVWNEELYLCTLGGQGARKEMATARAVSGVRRIVERLTQIQ